MSSTSRRRDLESQDAAPVISWLHRFSAFAFIFLSASFTIWYRLDENFMGRARQIIGEVFTPVTLAIYVPIAGLANGAETIGNHFDTVGQLAAVKAENQRIGALEEEIKRLEARLATADALARITFDEDFLTSRVINTNSQEVAEDLPEVIAISNLVDRKLIKINAGRRNGLQDNLPVINDFGLVGRVIAAGERSSTVMLLFDTASSVPALIEPLSARVTVRGTGGDDKLEIKLASSQVISEIQLGDRIVTSGQGELFPPGILIGTVSSLERGVQVTPAIDWSRLVHVRVLPRSGSGPGSGSGSGRGG